MAEQRKSLKERAQEMTARLPIMLDRDKGNPDDLLGIIVTINGYDFMEGVIDKKTKQVKDPFAVFTVAEDDANFFFGGMVITDTLQKLTAEGYADEIARDGLPVRFEKVKSKDGQTYTNAELYPEPIPADDPLDKAMGAKRK